MCSAVLKNLDEQPLLFLNKTEWEGADVEQATEDTGWRRYWRLSKGDKTALLMDMSKAGLEAGLEQYVKIDRFLTSIGVRVPEIYEHNLDSGLSIIEDMGRESFGDYVRAGKDRADLYRIATEILVKIRQNVSENNLDLITYNAHPVRERLSQFVEYYLSAALGRDYTQGDMNEYLSIWAEIEKNAPPCAQTFCHADYHLENLMWREEGNPSYGLIDFQDAFWGAQPYDLLNLLEDARQTVPDNIKQEMKVLYCEGMSAEEKEGFDAWYCILSMHFHCRVIGLFIKLHKERSKSEFLQHISRLQGYIKVDLQNPLMQPLANWIEEKGISLDLSLEKLNLR